jgi:hypothetical protein
MKEVPLYTSVHSLCVAAAGQEGADMNKGKYDHFVKLAHHKGTYHDWPVKATSRGPGKML